PEKYGRAEQKGGADQLVRIRDHARVLDLVDVGHGDLSGVIRLRENFRHRSSPSAGSLAEYQGAGYGPTVVPPFFKPAADRATAGGQTRRSRRIWLDAGAGRRSRRCSRGRAIKTSSAISAPTGSRRRTAAIPHRRYRRSARTGAAALRG